MNYNWLYILLTLLAESNWTLAIQNNRQVLKRSQQEQDGNWVEVAGWHRYRQRDSGCVYNKFSKPSKYLIFSFVSFLVAVTWARSAPLSRVPPWEETGRSTGSFPEQRLEIPPNSNLQFHLLFPARDSLVSGSLVSVVYCFLIQSGWLFRELLAGLFLKLLNCVTLYIYNGRIFEDYLIS